MAETVLNIQTDAPRRRIEIDGQSFELRWPDELSLLTAKNLQRSQPLFLLLREGQDISEDQIKEIIEALDRLIEQILIGAADVLPKLTDQQKVAIVSVFTGAGEKPANSTPKPQSEPLPV